MIQKKLLIEAKETTNLKPEFVLSIFGTVMLSISMRKARDFEHGIIVALVRD